MWEATKGEFMIAAGSCLVSCSTQIDPCPEVITIYQGDQTVCKDIPEHNEYCSQLSLNKEYEANYCADWLMKSEGRAYHVKANGALWSIHSGHSNERCQLDRGLRVRVADRLLDSLAAFFTAQKTRLPWPFQCGRELKSIYDSAEQCVYENVSYRNVITYKLSPRNEHGACVAAVKNSRTLRGL